MFKFRHHWFSAKELIDWWIYPMGIRLKLNARMTVMMYLKSYEHLMYFQFSPSAQWVHQNLLLRRNKIKSINKLPLTDLSILWNFYKWAINNGQRYSLRHLVSFILVIACNSLQVELLQQKIDIFFTLTLFSLAKYL